MAYIIRSDIEAMSQIVVQNKNTGLSISDINDISYRTDANGECTFPLLTKDEVDSIVSGLPLSQYGELYDVSSLSITSSGYSLRFNREIPAFIGGYLYNYPVVAVTAPTVASGTQTQYVYATLVLGEPIYRISTSQLQESQIIMFIGTITVGTSGITAINIERVSRFNTYRPSTTQKGSSFPVSTGNPTQTGTLDW